MKEDIISISKRWLLSGLWVQVVPELLAF